MTFNPPVGAPPSKKKVCLDQWIRIYLVVLSHYDGQLHAKVFLCHIHNADKTPRYLHTPQKTIRVYYLNIWLVNFVSFLGEFHHWPCFCGHWTEDTDWSGSRVRTRPYNFGFRWTSKFKCTELRTVVLHACRNVFFSIKCYNKTHAQVLTVSLNNVFYHNKECYKLTLKYLLYFPFFFKLEVIFTFILVDITCDC